MERLTMGHDKDLEGFEELEVEDDEDVEEMKVPDEPITLVTSLYKVMGKRMRASEDKIDEAVEKAEAASDMAKKLSTRPPPNNPVELQRVPPPPPAPKPIEPLPDDEKPEE